jgi:nucleoside-diphosphate-sugar epimerase
LIEGFIKLFFTSDIHEPINLGNPTPINMLELAEEIKVLTKSQSKIEMCPLPGDDPKQREPKIERAEKLLGWKPKVDRQTGFKKTVEYFTKIISS